MYIAPSIQFSAPNWRASPPYVDDWVAETGNSSTANLISFNQVLELYTILQQVDPHINMWVTSVVFGVLSTNSSHKD